MSTTSSAASARLSPRRVALVETVDALELELRRLGYWEAAPPAQRRLASPEPFCVDTLSLSEWLQWRFIPQLMELLDHGAALPEACAIHPYAEHCLSEEPRDVSGLLGLIQRIDALLSDPDSALAH